MEKRLVLFMVLSMLIFFGFAITRSILLPPKPQDQEAAQQDVPGNDKEQDAGQQGKANEADEVAQADVPKEDQTRRAAAEEAAANGQAEQVAADPSQDESAEDEPPLWETLGSFAADSSYRLLITLTNRGAAVERVELVERRSNGRLRYRDLTASYGYLGAQCRNTEEGCQVKAVGDGTPASAALGGEKGGIQVGDVLVRANETRITRCSDLDDFLTTTQPGEEINVTVRRGTGEQSQEVTFVVKLDERPLELIRPEADLGTRTVPSFLTGIHSIGNDEARFDDLELKGLASLRNSHWIMEQQETEKGKEIVFRKTVAVSEEPDATRLEFVKRYQLAQIPGDQSANHDFPGYHLTMNIEIWNRGKSDQDVAYRVDGPNGLPLEGWWYSYKTHPSWGSAGARDIIWRVNGKKESLRSPSQIHKELDKDKEELNPAIPLLADRPPREDRTLDYLGVDTQYFSAVMLAGAVQKPDTIVCQQAYSVPLGDAKSLEGKKIRTMNSTFRMVSERAKIKPGESVSHQFHLFLGPKSTNLLEEYGISGIIEYGWFGFVARPLSRLLHFFYRITWNYGLAIILLTVLVRGCMFPVGRKAARNAQMMQELAPEIKKIKEKYKNDMEKQAQAQRELWKKHNFNPLGGCWLMFLQLPIFIGLYRCLSVDIELRQAPLIPGVQWCSNLAAPDMFLNWETPSLQFLTGTAGWLGPYLNLLPIVTIALFMLQQKMFTPPATDEQTMMQQRMMKYMMVLMGFLFFKVPSGLCIYFIASSLWGIAERKLLPKPDLKKTAEASSLTDKVKRKADDEPDHRGKRKRRR